MFHSQLSIGLYFFIFKLWASPVGPFSRLDLSRALSVTPSVVLRLRDENKQYIHVIRPGQEREDRYFSPCRVAHSHFLVPSTDQRPTAAAMTCSMRWCDGRPTCTGVLTEPWCSSKDAMFEMAIFQILGEDGLS